MKTIGKSLRTKLKAQADEAAFLGITKVASGLTTSLDTLGARASDQGFIFTKDDLQKEVEDSLWTAAAQTQDFYGRAIDARIVHDLVVDAAEDFIASLANKLGTVRGVYDIPVAGEEYVEPHVEYDFEVSEDE